MYRSKNVIPSAKLYMVEALHDLHGIALHVKKKKLKKNVRHNLRFTAHHRPLLVLKNLLTLYYMNKYESSNGDVILVFL